MYSYKMKQQAPQLSKVKQTTGRQISYSDHVRKSYYIVVMGRSNSSGLCSVATWMHAIFFNH